jgi:hypothetical protein
MNLPQSRTRLTHLSPPSSRPLLLQRNRQSLKTPNMKPILCGDAERMVARCRPRCSTKGL